MLNGVQPYPLQNRGKLSDVFIRSLNSQSSTSDVLSLRWKGLVMKKTVWYLLMSRMINSRHLHDTGRLRMVRSLNKSTTVWNPSLKLRKSRLRWGPVRKEASGWTNPDDVLFFLFYIVQLNDRALVYTDSSFLDRTLFVSCGADYWASF